MDPTHPRHHGPPSRGARKGKGHSQGAALSRVVAEAQPPTYWLDGPSVE